MSKNFNDEVVWDNNRNLFSTYFQEKIRKAAHYVVYLNTSETEFEKAMLDIKKQYKTL